MALPHPNDRGHRERVHRILVDPDLYPDEFKAWLPRFMEQNPNFRIAQVQLPQVEPVRLVPAAGQPNGFQTGWVNYGSGWAEAGYYKDPYGRVHLQGLVKDGSAGIIFNLPAGYRPQANQLFANDTNAGHGRVDVHSDGNVVCQSGGTGYYGLFGISYRAFS